jgi:hypothetical protein
MSTKTSSGVPRVIILATLVVVLATSVEVVPHVGVGRCDGHHGFTLRVPHHFLDGRPRSASKPDAGRRPISQGFQGLAANHEGTDEPPALITAGVK